MLMLSSLTKASGVAALLDPLYWEIKAQVYFFEAFIRKKKRKKKGKESETSKEHGHKILWWISSLYEKIFLSHN